MSVDERSQPIQIERREPASGEHLHLLLNTEANIGSLLVFTIYERRCGVMLRGQRRQENNGEDLRLMKTARITGII